MLDNAKNLMYRIILKHGLKSKEALRVSELVDRILSKEGVIR